jgi:DNA-binding beta-propeller fold protein YncE
MRKLRGFCIFSTPWRPVVAMLAVAVVPACASPSGSGLAATPSQAPPGALGRGVPLRYAATACPSSVVYVVSNYDAAVKIYDRASLQAHARPCGSVTGFESPQGLFVDAQRGLWVVDAGAKKIYRFLPGAVTPIETLSDPNGTPLAVAVEPRSGTVYVTDYANSVDAHTLVEVYANGSTTPTGSLDDPNARNGGSDAVDNGGNLYVTFMTLDNKAQVDRWSHGSGSGENLDLKLISAGGVVTTATGALAVCDPFDFRCGIFEHHSTRMSHVFGHMGLPMGKFQSDKPPWLNPEALALAPNQRQAYVVANTLSVWRFPGPKNRPNHRPIDEIKVPNGGANEGIAVSPASPPGAPW